MLTKRTIGWAAILFGLFAFFGGQLAVYHSRDKVNSWIDAYVRGQSDVYRRGDVDISKDLARARARFSAETRPERVGFYAVYFGGMVLMFWGASRLRSGGQKSDRI